MKTEKTKTVSLTRIEKFVAKHVDDTLSPGEQTIILGGESILGFNRMCTNKSEFECRENEQCTNNQECFGSENIQCITIINQYRETCK